jgi:hypothetical protein
MMARLLCRVFGHRHVVYAKPVENWATGIRWLKCERCHRDFAINDRVRVLIPMSFELLDMHGWKCMR